VKPTRLAQLLTVAALCLAVASSAATGAEDPSDTDSPGLPLGDGTLRGAVVHPDGPGHTAGLRLALYSLRSDGSGGTGSADTDADGKFAFENLSTDPSLIYLVGVHYNGVAFSQRVGFAPGRRELAVVLNVSDPADHASAATAPVTLAMTAIRLTWPGAAIVVREDQLLRNAAASEVHIPSDQRELARAPFRAVLPTGASDFASPPDSRDSFSLHGDELHYWGPVRPGDQEIRYRYRIPVTGRVLRLRRGFPDGTERLELLFPAASGLRVESAELEPGKDVAFEGETYRSLSATGLPPGARVELTIELPQTRSDPAALTLDAVSLSVELDDTVLQVTQDQRLRVSAGAPLAGSRDAPLMHLELPPGAELAPLSAAATDMGIEMGADGGLDVRGPLMPGEHGVSWRYRIPVRDGSTRLDLRFPRDLPVLDMRVADTGLVIESHRLHRLQPRTMGTRSYLFRRARQIEAGETLSIRFRALERRSGSRRASLALVLVLAAGAVSFVMAPLRPKAGSQDSRTPEPESTALERELLDDTLRDLACDFETGKIAELDYRQRRAELVDRVAALQRGDPEAADDPTG
jgi:hypothetical protein